MALRMRKPTPCSWKTGSGLSERLLFWGVRVSHGGLVQACEGGRVGVGGKRTMTYLPVKFLRVFSGGAAIL